MQTTRAGFLKTLFTGMAGAAIAKPGTMIPPPQPVKILGTEVLWMKVDGNRLMTRLLLPSGIESTFYSVHTGDPIRDADIFVVQLNRNIEAARGWIPGKVTEVSHVTENESLLFHKKEK